MTNMQWHIRVWVMLWTHQFYTILFTPHSHGCLWSPLKSQSFIWTLHTHMSECEQNNMKLVWTKYYPLYNKVIFVKLSLLSKRGLVENKKLCWNNNTSLKSIFSINNSFCLSTSFPSHQSLFFSLYKWVSLSLSTISTSETHFMIKLSTLYKITKLTHLQ